MRRSLILTVIALSAILAPSVVVFAESTEPTAERRSAAQIREEKEKARAAIKERRENIREQVKERRAEIKKEICERRQKNLATLLPRLEQRASSFKKSMDTIYTRVTGFYESGKLTIENYEELAGKVEIAKANAQAAIAAVEEQKFTLDCENPSVGQQLDGYRLAVRSARSALGDYKKSLVNLVKAIRTAVTSERDRGSGNSTGESQRRAPDQGASDE